MAEQLAFPMPSNAAMGRGDFILAPCNRSALAMLDAWQTWPGNMLLLAGEPGSGKTHLAHIWAADTGAQFAEAIDLTQASVPELAAEGRVVVERIDAIQDMPQPEWAERERALFHLYNLLRSEGGTLLLTSRVAPAHMRIDLADLASRLGALTLIRLGAPDDALLTAVLAKLFADRQIVYAKTLIPYLVTRMDRSLSEAQRIVVSLDAAAWARKKPLTVQLAKDVLGWG